MNLSFKKVFYLFSCIIALFAVLLLGRSVLISFTIAILLSFILMPLASKLEGFGLNRTVSTFITLLLIVSFMGGSIYFFGKEIGRVGSELSDFEQKLNELQRTTIQFIDQKLHNVSGIDSNDLIDKSQEWVEESGGTLISDTLSRTTTIFSGLIVVLVYTFLLLLYRGGIKDVIINTAARDDRDKVSSMIYEMQDVGKHYLFGMSVMIGILGVANSVVLLLFGIEHPFFFGFLAALLAIVPYVGTTLGASIPVIYAFMTHSSYWVPLGIMFSFWLIQLIESNYLSPKIVGGNLNLNALAAIMSLIIGGVVWGVAGLVLFLPLAAIFRVFCGYFEQLRPVSQLLGNDLYKVKNE